MAVAFPSLGFFEALREAMRAERDRFARLGYFDTTFGVRVLPADGGAPAEFVLAFEVFDCVGAAEGTRGDLDFVLEGPLPVWREMFDAIHALGAADTAHGINTLTHFGEALRVVYDDPDGHDKLYRFAESIQQFFDLAARIDIVYPDGGRPPARQTTLERSAS